MNDVCPNCHSRNRLTRNYVYVPEFLEPVLCGDTWHSEHQHHESEDTERVIRAVHKVFEVLVEIRGILKPRLTSAILKLKDIEMPKTVNIGETAQAVITGLDQNGSLIALDATYTVAYQASNPADVSFGTPNADGSNTVTAVAPDTGDVISAIITRPDGQQITTTSDTLIVNAPAVPVLTSATLVLQ